MNKRKQAKKKKREKLIKKKMNHWRYNRSHNENSTHMMTDTALQARGMESNPPPKAYCKHSACDDLKMELPCSIHGWNGGKDESQPAT